MSNAQWESGPADARSERFGIILVDLQNDFCHTQGVFHRAGFTLTDTTALVEHVNVLARTGRAGGHFIVWTRMVWDNDEDLGLLAQRSPFLAHEGLRRGTWGANLLDDLDVDPSDIALDKTRFSSFYETPLEHLLQRERINRLVVAGLRTDFCVESTVRDAFFRDFEVLIPSEAVAGYVDDLHQHSLRVMNTVFARVTTLDEARRLLQPAQSQTHEEVSGDG